MLKKIARIVLIMLSIFVTGCTNHLQEGTIEGYNYKETDEITNYVKIVTNKNKIIIIELYPDKAPLTVQNFQKLVSEKFYDNLIFHRVIADFMIQGGDPNGNGTGGSEETIIGEFKNNGYDNDLIHEEGVISMARQDDNNDETTADFNTASSQFFICVNSHENLSYLDGNYAAFGKVIAGYDNVLAISHVSTDDYDRPLQEQSMKTVRFVEVTE